MTQAEAPRSFSHCGGLGWPTWGSTCGWCGASPIPVAGGRRLEVVVSPRCIEKMGQREFEAPTMRVIDPMTDRSGLSPAGLRRRSRQKGLSKEDVRAAKMAREAYAASVRMVRKDEKIKSAERVAESG